MVSSVSNVLSFWAIFSALKCTEPILGELDKLKYNLRSSGEVSPVWNSLSDSYVISNNQWLQLTSTTLDKWQ